MSKHHALKAHSRKRSGSGALNSLRREGLIPAVVYGKGLENVNIRLNRKDVEHVLNNTVSKQILVDLTIEDLNETKLALIQDVQHDPLTGNILHVDFHAIREDEFIHASVPLHLTGEAAGAKAGGLVELLVHNLNINCLPKDLPERIDVDITELQIGSSLHVKELKLPEGITTKLGGDVVVVRVSAPKVVEITAPSAQAEAGGKKGKGKK